MKIEVTEVKDREDGGADLEFELDEEGKDYLINLGVKYLLLMSITEMSQEEIMEALIGTEEE